MKAFRLNKSDRGRLLACILLSLLFAIVTGPDGSGDDPLRGIKASLHGRVVYFILGGVILFALLVVGRVIGPHLRGPKAQLSSMTAKALARAK